MLYLNPHGHEVLLDHETIELIKARGEWHLYKKPEPAYSAKGPKNKILLLLNVNGIGDDICAMPAIAQKISEGYEITVAAREFTRECYEALGCTFISENETYPGYIAEHQSEYGEIHSLKMWCLDHDSETSGYVSKDRFTQFAEKIGTTVPKEFSWVTVFNLPKREPEGYTLYAPKSIAPMRSYPHAARLEHLLEGDVRLCEKKETFRDLIDEVYRAKRIVAVDNGILHLALALGVPAVGIYGPTDERYISESYERFHPIDFTAVRVNTVEGCFTPCSAQPARGYGAQCKRKAQCLVQLDPSTIAQAIV